MRLLSGDSNKTDATSRHAWRRVLLIALTACLGACDCDDKLRKMLSDGKGEQRRGDTRKDGSDQPISSDPTETEPNESSSQASAYELGSELRSVLSEFSTQKDIDWYTITSSEDRLIELTVDPTEPSLDPVIVLSVGGEELRYDIARAGEPEVIPVVLLGSQRLLLRVEAKAGAGKYAIRFKKRLAGGQIESEPNDLPAVATRHEAPGEIEGFHDRPQDTDLYHLVFPEVPEGEVALYAIEVIASRELGERVSFMLAPSGEPIMTSQIDPEGKIALPNLAITKARPDLWLKLEGTEKFSREQPYRVVVRAVKAGDRAAGQFFDAEPNDSAEAAQELLMGNDPIQVAGFFHRAEDMDYFALVLGDSEATAAPEGAPAEEKPEPSKLPDKSEKVQDLFGDDKPTGLGAAPEPSLPPLPVKTPPPHALKLEVKPLRDDLKLVLRWGASGEERTHLATTAGESISLCNVPLSAGKYPFAIAPQSLGDRAEGVDGKPDYRVVIEDLLAGSPEGSAREIEPNETFEQPDALPLGGKVTGYLASSADRDIFALDILATKGADPLASAPSTTIELAAHPLDTILKVYDDQGLVLAEQDTGGAGRAEKFTFRLPPGRYFVEVRSKLGSSCEPYLLGARR